MRLSLGSVAALAAAMLIAFAFWPENRAVQGPPQIVAQEMTQPVKPAAKRFGTSIVASRVFGELSATNAKAPEQRPQFEVCRPVAGEVVDRYQAPGYLKPSQFVQIRSLASGYLQKVHFRAGQSVKRGDPLFEIDSRLRAAELNKAEAEVSRAESRFRHASVEWDLMNKLHRSNAATTGDLSRIEGERDAARADLQAAKADLDISQLKLSYTRITAPIDGRISAPAFDVGNLVKADETTLATLSCLDPMYVSFHVDRTTWLRLRAAVARPGKQVPVQLLNGDLNRKIRGAVESVGDSGSPDGTIQVRAVVSNPDGLLIPGLNVPLELTVGDPFQALLVPYEAVAHDKNGRPCVFVVTEHHVVEPRFVKFGPLNGLQAVKEGLKAEDWVVMNASRIMVLEGRTVEPKQVGCSPVSKSAGSSK